MLQWGRNFFVTEITLSPTANIIDQPSCFNGAVTFSLRKFRFGSSKLNSLSLQWGRNFFVTEISTILQGIVGMSLLQWGRNFFVTEMGQLDQMYSLQVLQWGRNFFVTEIARLAQNLLNYSCFSLFFLYLSTFQSYHLHQFCMCFPII